MKIETISIEKITSNPMNPREKFDREKLDELAESAKTVGIKVPLIVRPKGRQYEIVSGGRRWEAAKKANLKQLTAIVKELNDEELAIESFIANEFRENLDPWERAKFLKRIKKMIKVETDEELGRIVGVSKSAIVMIWGYLKVDEEVKEKVHHGELEARSARIIASIPDKQLQRKVAEKAEKEELTVKETEKLVSTVKKAAAPIKKIVLEEKIKPEVAERIIETTADITTQKELIKEMAKSEKDLKKYQEETITKVEKVVKGEQEPDIRILNKAKQLQESIHKTWVNVRVIDAKYIDMQPEKYKTAIIKMLWDMHDHLEHVLSDLGESTTSSLLSR